MEPPTIDGRAPADAGRRPAWSAGPRNSRCCGRRVESAFAGGTGLVVVEGEPGVGKTRLLEEVAAEADRRGALVVWGRCLEGDGTPSMWPWVQAVGTVLDSLPAAAREKWLAGELGRLVEPHDDVARRRGAAGQRRPVPPVRAGRRRHRPGLGASGRWCWSSTTSSGPTSPRCSCSATWRPGYRSGTALIGALRDRAPAPGSELARVLAAASRLPGHRRIRLGPLGPAEVAELVRRETGQRSRRRRRPQHPRPHRRQSVLRPGAVPAARRRRPLITTDAAARAGVPSTVRDVVRDRMAGLDDGAQDLLQHRRAHRPRRRPRPARPRRRPRRRRPASTASSRWRHSACSGQRPGTRSRSASRTTWSASRSPRPRRRARATRLHLRVADALERTDADDESVAERLAHHLWAAGPLADPARTADALVRAGRRAAAKSAFEAADAAPAIRPRRSPGRRAWPELELSALSQLTAVVGMRSRYGGSALDLLERAEQLARSLGREREAADFLFSRWAAHSQGIELDRGGPLARRLLEQGEASADPIVRAYGLQAWGIHQWDIGNIGEAFRI